MLTNVAGALASTMAIDVAPTAAVGSRECWRQSSSGRPLGFSLRGSRSVAGLRRGLEWGRRRCTPNHDIGGILEFALATVLAGIGAHFRSRRILTAVSWVAVPPWR